MKFIIKNKYLFIIAGLTLLAFTILFFDVLFLNKTLRGEPYAQGVLPTGPVFYNREIGEFRSHTDDPGASAWNNNPPFKIAIEQVKDGFIPWWNPYNGTGTPLLASLQSGIMFPPKLIILFFSQSPFMFDIYVLFRLLVALVFTYLFLRLHGIGRSISFVAGISFAFSGSLLRYVNLEHLNIDAFIPFYLFAVEYFIQKLNFKSWLLMLLCFSFMILGGFPEASLFAFILTSFYFLYRWFELKRNWQIFINWVAANVIALFLSLPILLPFLIHMSETWTIHHPEDHVGTLFLPVSVIFALVSPYFFTPTLLVNLGIERHLLLPGWIGAGILIFASMAIFLPRKKWGIGAFFAIFALIALLKDFGFFLVNWIGYLPIINQAIVFKYLNPTLTFSAIAAAAFYLQYILKNKATLFQLGAGLVGFISLYGYFIWRYHHAFVDFTISTSVLSAEALLPKHLLFLIFLTGLGLSLLALVFITRWKSVEKFKKIIVASILIGITLEVFISAPKYHPRRDQGYPEVKFLTDLKSKLGSEYRVSGKDYVLFPDFSGVYQLSDPRLLDAMYLSSFYEYVKTVDPRFHDRFINLSNEWFQNPETLRAIGVKYILATGSLEESAAITSIAEDYKVPQGIWEVNGEARKIISIHPPYEKTITVKVPDGTRETYFYLTMHPDVWSPSKGDGVCLNLTVIESKERVCIDPKHNNADRVWKKIPINIPEGSEEITLNVEVDELSSSTFDWVAMTDLVSSEENAEVNSNFSVTEGFPINVDKIRIYSYTLKDAKKIAYFPSKVNFVDDKEFVTSVKDSLHKIDSEVVAVGEMADVEQNGNTSIKIEAKVNGEFLFNLEDGHPRYLYISNPVHKNLTIKDQNDRDLKWYKTNIGFITVDTEGVSEVRLSNTPNNKFKLLLLGFFGLGLLLIFLRYKTWKSSIKAERSYDQR